MQTPAPTVPTQETFAPNPDVKEQIRTKAGRIGFDGVRFTGAGLPSGTDLRLTEFLEAGLQGDMGWLAANADRRADPRVLWPEARSIVMLGVNYGPDRDPLDLLNRPERASVSVYARNADYHDLVKKRLKTLGRWMQAEFGGALKVFVDTAPVMEKPLAAQSGLGWQGKHTNLVSRDFGSWLFLGAIFTTLSLPPDPSEADHCGSCRNCLDICPTAAFPAPYRLDATRCISYLTIEHKGHIAEEFRAPMGNRIYGCDDCLAVCPWNKFATQTAESAFLPRVELTAPKLDDLAQLDDEGFRQVFRGSPIKRIGRDRFVRNVLIAIGNSGMPALAKRAEALLDDSSPLVRAMAVWALGRLVGPEAIRRLRDTYAAEESDAAVLAEWQAVSAPAGSEPGRARR